MKITADRDRPGVPSQVEQTNADERFLAQLRARADADPSEKSRLRAVLRAQLANPATRPIVAGPWPARRAWLGGMAVMLVLVLALTLHSLGLSAPAGGSSYAATAKYSRNALAKPDLNPSIRQVITGTVNGPRPQPTPLPPRQTIIKAPAQSPAPLPDIAPVSQPAPKP